MDRYTRPLVAEILRVFLLGVAASGLLLTVGMGALEGMRRGLPAWLILVSFPYTVPETLRFAMPGCLLFAVCAVIGRVSAGNELVALQSLGISPWKIVRPLLVLGVVISLMTFATYEWCAGWSRPCLRRLWMESITEVAYNLLRVDGAFTTQGISLVVQRVDGKRLVEPVMFIGPSPDKPRMRLTAREAILAPAKGENALAVACRGAELEVEGQGVLNRPDDFVYEITLGKGPPSEDTLPPAALRLYAIGRQIARETQIVASLAAGIGSGLDALTTTAQDDAKPELARHRERLNRLRAEPHRRLANGFACLGFCLIGIPVAARWRTGGTMAVFFVCFLPILLVYYPLLVSGETIARLGVAPSVSVWLADGVLLVAGGLLLWAMVRR